MTRRQARAEQTRTRILDAGEECFAAAGFERTRLEDVAGKVGVRRGAIFHYFAGKRELYEAVLIRLGESLMRRLREAVAEQETLPDRFEAAVEIMNPFNAITYNPRDFDPDFIGEIGPQAAIAVGLAVRKVGDR